MSFSRPDRRGARAVVLAVAVLTTGSCSSVGRFVAPDDRPDRVSLRKYALDIAFGGTEPDLVGEGPEQSATPVAPMTEVPLVDLAAQVFDLPLERSADGLEPSSAPDPCPEPAPGAVAERPLTPDVSGAVEPGVYLFKQSGHMEIVGVARVGLSALTSRIVRGVSSAPGRFEYDVELFTGTRRQVVEFLVVEGDGVFVRGIETAIAGSSNSFNPIVPVEVLPLPAGPGTRFSSVGLDPATAETLVVEATVTKADRISGCGEVVDGWLVESSWSFSRPTPSGTATRAYDYDYAVAPQHGGLIVGDHMVTLTPESYGPFAATLDVTSALGRITPKPEEGRS